MGNDETFYNLMQVNRRGQHYPTKRFAVWRDEVVRQIRAAFRAWDKDMRFTTNGFENAHYLCAVEYWPNDKRTRDVSGMLDALFHCFEKAGIIANDGQIKHVSWQTQPQQEEARLVINIDEIT